MYARVCLEEAVISSRGGASLRCLYRAGEPSPHLPTRVAPSPFVRRCAARAGELTLGCRATEAMFQSRSGADGSVRPGQDQERPSR